MNERADEPDGFTLVEVLVAVVILAIATGVAFRAVSDSFARLTEAEHEQRALTIVDNTLERLGHDLAFQPGFSNGLQDGIEWRLEIGQALADPQPASGLAAYPVTVSVQWKDGRVTRRFDEKTIRLGPANGPL
jgi:general secretion pathway protein I